MCMYQPEKITCLTPWLSHSNFVVTGTDTDSHGKGQDFSLSPLSLNLKLKSIKWSKLPQNSHIMKLTPMIIHYYLEWISGCRFFFYSFTSALVNAPYDWKFAIFYEPLRRGSIHAYIVLPHRIQVLVKTEKNLCCCHFHFLHLCKC